MSYRLEFELNGLPKMTNPSGARSTHWRVVKAERDRWKLATIAVIRSRRPLAPLERARLTLTRFSSTSPDYDGLVSGFKSILDALVKGGVLANDKFTNIGAPQYLWIKCQPRKGKIRVVVEEIIDLAIPPKAKKEKT